MPALRNSEDDLDPGVDPEDSGVPPDILRCAQDDVKNKTAVALRMAAKQGAVATLRVTSKPMAGRTYSVKTTPTAVCSECGPGSSFTT